MVLDFFKEKETDIKKGVIATLSTILLAILASFITNWIEKTVKSKRLINATVIFYEKIEEEHHKLGIKDPKIDGLVWKIFNDKIQVLDSLEKIKEDHPYWSDLITSYLALILLNSGEELKSIELLKKYVLKIDEKHYMANEITGVAYVRLMQMSDDKKEISKFFKEALIKFSKNIKNHPDRSLSHFNLGWLYQQTGYSEKAEEHFRKAKELEPDRYIESGWFWWKMLLYKAPGVYATEDDHFKIVKKYLNNTPISQEKINDKIASRASKILESRFEDISEVKKFVKKIDEKIKDDSKKGWEYTYACSSINKARKSENFCEILCKVAKDNGVYEQSENQEIKNLLNWDCAFNSSSHEFSIQHYEKIIKNDPDFECDALNNIGKIKGEEGRYEEEFFYYKRSIVCDKKRNEASQVPCNNYKIALSKYLGQKDKEAMDKYKSEFQNICL